MSLDYLNEAFKKLNLLNEETFDTSLDGINELSNFMDQDASTDEVKVIDPEAETEDDLQDSYIGKVITNCNVCHSHIFENKEDIVINEDGVVNPDKQCPYCGETAGFVIVGEITEFTQPTGEGTDENPKVEVDGEEVTVETEEPAEENLTESFNFDALRISEEDLTDLVQDEVGLQHYEGVSDGNLNFKEALEYGIKNLVDTIKKDYGYICTTDDINYLKDLFTKFGKNYSWSMLTKDDFLKWVKNHDEGYLDDAERKVFIDEVWDVLHREMKEGANYEDMDDANIIELVDSSDNPLHDLGHKFFGLLDEGLVTESRKPHRTNARTVNRILKTNESLEEDSETFDKESRALKPHTRRLLALLNNDGLTECSDVAIDEDLADIDGTIASVLTKHSSEIDACNGNETAVKDCVINILSSDEVKDRSTADDAIRIIKNCRGGKLWSTLGTYMSGEKVISSRSRNRRLVASLEEDSSTSSIFNIGDRVKEKWANPYNVGTVIDHRNDPEEGPLSQVRWDYSDREDVEWVCDQDLSEYSEDDERAGYYEAVEDINAGLKEDVNNVNVETDDSIVNVATDETGKVTVSTEPRELETTDEEAVGPVSDDTMDEIESNNSDVVDEIPDEEFEESPEDIDFDIDDVDEEGLDGLGESYLKKVYENVKSFKTTSVSTDDSHMVIEGLITFNSGVEKKTGFIFEACSATTDGKVKFVGRNEHFSRGSKAFTLTGTITNKKLISESLTYNYRTKVSDGKSVRVYGTVRNK